MRDTFSNPDIPEGINVSRDHPLKEFAKLACAAVVLALLVLLALHLGSEYLARKIPFQYEQKLLNGIKALQPSESPQQARLQALAQQLSQAMDLPAGMSITVHYSEDKMVNAFATLGGHVFMFRGLMDKLESGQALAMVLAHEIAHIKHRHPVVAMTRGLSLSLAMSVLSGLAGSGASNTVIGETLQLGLLKFSRDQESESDLSAAKALVKLYGNISGARELFAVFAALERDGLKVPAIFSSHPHSAGRWEELAGLAKERGWSLEP